jgi:hypothetical protein
MAHNHGVTASRIELASPCPHEPDEGRRKGSPVLALEPNSGGFAVIADQAIARAESTGRGIAHFRQDGADPEWPRQGYVRLMSSLT